MCCDLLIPFPYGGLFSSWSTSNFQLPFLNPNIYLYDLPLPQKSGEGSTNKTPNSHTERITTTPIPPLGDNTPKKIIKENTKVNTKIEQNMENVITDSNMVVQNPINRIISEITSDSLRDVQSTPDNSLAPYRYHPLLHFLKQRINLDDKMIIELRNDNSKPDNATTTLILKPVARSVAGVDGTAIANPVSRAALRKGVNVDILFEPDAIAIAGPGGIAHAESDLEIYYEDTDLDGEMEQR